jgi:hypothetical protein
VGHAAVCAVAGVYVVVLAAVDVFLFVFAFETKEAIAATFIEYVSIAFQSY